MKKAFLIFVDGNGVNSNKYYNMEQTSSDSFTATYGRVGKSKTTHNYPMSKWTGKFKNKLNKGYTDITHLKEASVTVAEDSGNLDFDKFYEVFSKYTTLSVNKTYLVDRATKQQISAAQDIIDKLTKIKSTNEFNENLIDLFKIIPRKMDKVADHFINSISEKSKVILQEQDALDGMDSSSIMTTVNPFKELNIDFKEIDCPDWLAKQVDETNDTRKKIHKVYSITDLDRIDKFNNWIKKVTDKTVEYLFHGTRNANVFSILKSGLLIRPSNAVSFAGSAYGDGIYHSAHTAKSMGYTGYDDDSLFLIQNVHVGKKYTYSGWYRDGKDISRSQMNFSGMQNLGCDSLYVKPGDGLMNSEYIVFDDAQSITEFLVHFK